MPLVRPDSRIEGPIISKHCSFHGAEDRSPFGLLDRFHLGNRATMLGDRYGFTAALDLVENAQAVRLELRRADPLVPRASPEKWP